MKKLLLATAILFMSVQPALAADTTRPTVSMVSPTEADVGDEITFTITYSDDDEVTSCNLYVEFEDKGGMALSNGVASLDYTFTGGGVYTVFVHCKDATGNATNGQNTSVVVSASSSNGDTTPPTVGTVSPDEAQVDEPIEFEADYSDGDEVSSCRLIVNGFDRGSMTLSAGTATKSHTFDEEGSVPVYVQCTDTSGNTGAGAVVSVSVSEEAPAAPIIAPPPPPPLVATGLVKTACPADSTATHPCRSVYYRATDGTRHAFPNEKIYFTWYADFSGIEEITASEMADLPLGGNVTYRPGVRMVKFVADNRVYAVSRAGMLRWVSNEAVATELYGTAWNTKIDDLSDAFAADYTTGVEITNPANYSPAEETAGTTSINTNL